MADIFFLADSQLVTRTLSLNYAAIPIELRLSVADSLPENMAANDPMRESAI